MMASLRVVSSSGVWLANGLCASGDDNPESRNSSLKEGGQGLEKPSILSDCLSGVENKLD